MTAPSGVTLVDFDVTSPPPPEHRATDNLASEYFRGLSTENADLWMIPIENGRSYRQMNEEQTKAAIPLFFKDGAAFWYQALADNKKGHSCPSPGRF